MASATRARLAALALCLLAAAPAAAATAYRPLSTAPPRSSGGPGPVAPPSQVFDDDRSFDKGWASKFAFGDVTDFLVESSTADSRNTFWDPRNHDSQETERQPSPSGTVAPSDAQASRTIDTKSLPRDPACGCPYTGNGHLADPTHCDAMRGDVNESDARVVAVPVVDPRAVAAPLACFRRGHCQIDGVEFGGITCCSRDERGYLSAMRDPHLYILAPLPLSKQIEGMVPGRAAEGSPRVCGFAIDRAAGVFSLPSSLNGVTARAWLYAAQHYGTRPPWAIATLVDISSTSPASRFEVARERLGRVRFSAPMSTLDGALRSTPISKGLQSLGVRE